MKIVELMTRSPVSITPETPLAQALALMERESLRHLPVVERGKLAGILSDRDLLEATGGTPERALDLEARAPKVARDSMSVSVETLTRDDDLALALELFLERRIGCLPVVDGQGRLEGMLTVADLVTALVRASAIAPGMSALDAVAASRMSAPVVTAPAGTTVRAALELCREHSIRHLPVESDGWFVGLVSDRDLRQRAARGELDLPLQRVMTTRLATLGPEALLSDAARLMSSKRIDCVPVTSGGRLLGMITTTDVLRAFREQMAPPSGR